jgi:sec-independent protein translocase protein TatB
MLNIGTGEIILIAVAALLILGPTRLPEFARTIGKYLREFRRQTDDVRHVVEREFYQMDANLTPSLTTTPDPVLRPAPDALAVGQHEPVAHDSLTNDALGHPVADAALHTGADPALPTGEADLSQVMKGATSGEPVVRDVEPRPVEARELPTTLSPGSPPGNPTS